MAKFSFVPRSVPMDLENAEILVVDDDPIERVHWQLVANHPAFPGDLHALAEDLVGKPLAQGRATKLSSDLSDDVFVARLDLLDEDELREALGDPNSAAYPVLCFSKKWGIAPSVAITFAALQLGQDEVLEPDDLLAFRQEARGIIVHRTETEFVLQIPRPFTGAQRKRLRQWTKDAPREGHFEEVWGRAGKTRDDPSDSLVEAIPWFRRWNDHRIQPTQIWRELTDEGGISSAVLKADNVRQGIVRVWERMKALSPEGIREDRPSRGES